METDWHVKMKEASAARFGDNDKFLKLCIFGLSRVTTEEIPVSIMHRQEGNGDKDELPSTLK